MNTNTESPFQVGVVVAYDSGYAHSLPQKRTITKVHKNGRFFIEGRDTPWTPGWRNEDAQPSGKQHFEHRLARVTLWTEKTDAHIAAVKVEKAHQERARAVVDWITSRRYGNGRYALSEAQLVLLEQAMAIKDEV